MQNDTGPSVAPEPVFHGSLTAIQKLLKSLTAIGNTYQIEAYFVIFCFLFNFWGVNRWFLAEIST